MCISPMEHLPVIPGWVYGEKRDTEKKTHLDLVPYDQLLEEERQKDAIFLAMVWLVKQIMEVNK